MTKIIVKIHHESAEYPIIIKDSIYDDLNSFVNDGYKDLDIVIITDDNINTLFGKEIMKLLEGRNPHIRSIQPGERSKSRETKAQIEDEMLGKEFGRDTLIIAFGGGVVGDLGGFVASTYKRGIPVIQIPTSLLAMVDSAIGGKTAVNTIYGKNLIGSFWQPEAVFVGMDFLEKLPEKEFLNGLAEAVKMAIVFDEEFFNFFDNNSEKILNRDKEALTHIVKKCISLKKEVVQEDEKESGFRQCLNFGHTIGHAVESIAGYNEKHGFCVSMGIAAEVQLAALTGELEWEAADRISKLLAKMQLPNKINEKYEKQLLYKKMKSDKKAVNQTPMFVTLQGIGKIKREENKYSFSYDKSTVLKAISLVK
jgi:3-dehydroquinate synthase